MAKPRVTIKGIPELDKAFKEAAAEAHEAAAEAVALETHAIRDDARRIAPVDTGALRGSISGRAEGTDGRVHTGIRYSEFVEHGTKSRPAQPFMLPAAELARRRLPARAAMIIKAALERRGR